MKRMLSLLLVLTMVLSLFAGCGSTQTEEKAEEPMVAATTQPAETAEPTTEPTTEPTLSPEEQLLASLPERTRQAYEVGLVTLEQLEDLDRIVTIGEASEMLQKAYVHRTGVESKNLSELINTPEYAEQTADRFWIYNIPGQVDMELTYGDKYTDRVQWLKFITDTNRTDSLWCDFPERLGMFGAGFIAEVFDGMESYRSAGVIINDAFSTTTSMMTSGNGAIYGPKSPSSPYSGIGEYGVEVFDGTNGKRFFTLEDNGSFNPTGELTVADAAEYALIFYNYPNPMAVPEFVAPEDVGTYNTDIITEDLLTKDTDLPAASCEQLPSDWHGVVMDDMQLIYDNNHWDNNIYEYEIQAVKEAGFNYIGLELDFNWLQDMILYSDRNHVGELGQKEDEGKLSLERLEQLDQVLAYCMQYDIHLNLRATGTGGWNEAGTQDEWAPHDWQWGRGDDFAALWQAIARRYADIPNEYLSFTLFTGTDTKLSSDQVLPTIDAIRAESPDRCIIADIYHEGMDAVKFAEKGVALSYRMGDNVCDAFEMDPEEMASYPAGKIIWVQAGLDAIRNFSWPYEGTVDAAALLTSGAGQTCQDVMATAQEYGVGFMLGEFGVSYEAAEKWGSSYPRIRYPDKAYQGMITDVTSTMEDMGYGWCFASWYGAYGVAFCIPAIEGVEYEQIEDYPYYIDQGMMGLFQQINGVR